jgi:general secretion pathway protein C
MKRLPLAGSVLAVVLLSASLAYWGLQLFKPPQRAIAAPPPPPPVALNLDAAKGLFGGQISVAAASNYQLKGVVASQGSGSAAILAVDNKPALALGIGKEVVPGVTVKEVHPRYVLLSEGGAIKRIDLPSDAGATSAPGPAGGQPYQSMQPGQQGPQAPPPAPAMQPPPSMPTPQQQQQLQQQQQQQQQNPPRSSTSSTTIAPVPGFDRQQ